jgi:hypothetical protein
MRMGAMARKAEESHNQTDVSFIRNMPDFQCSGSARPFALLIPLP